jgi:hypothetical protein
MPIVFEEVTTEIRERSSEPQRTDEKPGAGEPAAPLHEMLRELDVLAERRARLTAD